MSSSDHPPKKVEVNLSAEERARLGEPPGKKAREEAQRKSAEAERLARIERELAEVEAHKMPLMEHLVELKDRLIKSVLALIIGSSISFFFVKDIFAFIARPFDEAMANAEGITGGLSLVNSPFEGIFTYFKSMFLGGLLLALPVITYQIWQFVAPALLKSEKKLVVPLSIFSLLLFLAGGAFCYYLIFPYAFPFMVSMIEADVSISVSGYLSAVLRMMIAFGVCFQMPVVSWFLSRAGVVDHKDLLGFMRYAIVIIFFLSALITPPDPATMIMLAIPMTLLYVVGVGISYFTSTKVRPEKA